jgi:putative glutamine amidotransferase
MALIGITACRKLEDYRQSVLHVGGEVRVLEPTENVMEALNGVDGLMLTGGEDVDPSRYGGTPHPTIVDVNAARDEFEIALVAEARRRRLPILAICRGVQVLNVACGGTLVKDIPSEIKGALEHRLQVPPHESYALAHEVWLDKDTLLARLMRERLSDADAFDVHSRHHQAGSRLAPGFVSSARPMASSRRLKIERPFCLGVQWHPELLAPGEFRPLRGSSGARTTRFSILSLSNSQRSPRTVFGNRSKAAIRVSPYPASTRRLASRASVATSHDT